MKMTMLILSVAVGLAVLVHAKDTKKQESRLIVERKFDVESGGRVKVDAPGSDVSVQGWDKNEVAIKVYGTQDAEDDHSIQFDTESGAIRLKIERNTGLVKKMFSTKNYSMRVEVKAPNRTELTVETAGGDIRANHIEGHGKLSTAGGDISSEGCIGIYECSTAGGDVRIRAFTGKLECSTAGGDIRAEVSRGSIKASTAGGDVQMLVRDSRVEASSIGGDISLDYYGENKGIDLSSTGGDIRIKAPAALKASIKFTSMGGDVVSNLGATKFKKKSLHSITAEINGGGPEIECSSTGGDIVITE